MGFLKEWARKRRIKAQNEQLKLKIEKERLLMQRSITKTQKKTRELTGMQRNIEEMANLQDLAAEIGGSKNELMDFIESPIGQKLVEGLLAKFLPNSPTLESKGVVEIIKGMTPEQKKKGMALLKEVMHND